MMSFEVPAARGGLPGYILIANKIAWKDKKLYINFKYY